MLRQKCFRKMLSLVLMLIMLVCMLLPELAVADTVQLQITKCSVSEVTADGYTVTASFKASAGVKEVLMPTWTENAWQDDLIWHKASVSGNTAVFHVRTADHKGEAGKYITHIYVRGKAGNEVLEGVEVTVPSSGQSTGTTSILKISSLTKSDVTSAGYRVKVSFTASAGVSEVLMPTWTEKNGQDDLIWHKASISGNTASFYVPVSAHKNERGTYITHVYVKDKTGKQVLEGIEITVPAASLSETVYAPPVINSIKTSEVASSGYRVTIDFTVSGGVKEVLVPTWTEKNGQDDLIWHVASVSGNRATFYVSAAAHKKETGKYITHVYVYDTKGRQALEGIEVTLPIVQTSVTPAKPKINSVTVTDVTASGYTITASFSAAAGVDIVLMPTWTEKNGQDDLIWYNASVNGSTASLRVSTGSHKGESGTYITHIYVYDKTGDFALTGKNTVVPQKTASGHVVCIDAGHQRYGIAETEPNAPGSSVMKAKLTTGTSGIVTGLAEYQLNLDVSLLLKKELLNRGYQVIMIRETNDCPMSNAERAVYANNSGAEIFVRIHANGSANTAVSGSMCYAPSYSNPYLGSGVISSSNRLAATVLNGLCAAAGTLNKGVLQDDTMTGINWCTIPVTIVEMGFMSNPDEDRRMADPAYQARMAKGIANGIDAYFGK